MQFWPLVQSDFPILSWCCSIGLCLQNAGTPREFNARTPRWASRPIMVSGFNLRRDVVDRKEQVDICRLQHDTLPSTPNIESCPLSIWLAQPFRLGQLHDTHMFLSIASSSVYRPATKGLSWIPRNDHSKA